MTPPGSASKIFSRVICFSGVMILLGSGSKKNSRIGVKKIIRGCQLSLSVHWGRYQNIFKQGVMSSITSALVSAVKKELRRPAGKAHTKYSGTFLKINNIEHDFLDQNPSVHSLIRTIMVNCFFLINNPKLNFQFSFPKAIIFGKEINRTPSGVQQHFPLLDKKKTISKTRVTNSKLKPQL